MCYKVWVYTVYGWKVVASTVTYSDAHRIMEDHVGRAYVVDVLDGSVVARKG